MRVVVVHQEAWRARRAARPARAGRAGARGGPPTPLIGLLPPRECPRGVRGPLGGANASNAILIQMRSRRTYVLRAPLRAGRARGPDAVRRGAEPAAPAAAAVGSCVLVRPRDVVCGWVGVRGGLQYSSPSVAVWWDARARRGAARNNLSRNEIKRGARRPRRGRRAALLLTAARARGSRHGRGSGSGAGNGRLRTRARPGAAARRPCGRAAAGRAPRGPAYTRPGRRRPRRRRPHRRRPRRQRPRARS